MDQSIIQLLYTFYKSAVGRAEVHMVGQTYRKCERTPLRLTRKTSACVYRFIDEQFCLQTKEIVQNFPRRRAFRPLHVGYRACTTELASYEELSGHY